MDRPIRRIGVSGAAVVSAVVALSSFGTPAIAGDRHGHHGGPPEAMMEKHLDQLDLEPEQRDRIREVLAASKEERKASRRASREAFREMRELLEAENPDEEAVMRQAEKMGELKTEGHKAMLRTLLAVRAELTPEQREKMKELRAERRKGFWRERHERREGRPRDGGPAGE